MSVFLTLFVAGTLGAAAVHQPAEEPLLDWSAWEQYRSTIAHPAVTVKREHLARARENLARYPWAQGYLKGLEGSVKQWPARMTPRFLEQMIPATTPGDTLFTPCPACREQGKPVHPHGIWRWTIDRPEELVCQVCKTVFPNQRYPEEIQLSSAYAPGQRFTYCGGEPFQIFGYVGRPSFSGNIRAQKVQAIVRVCRQLSEAYALTGNVTYARSARDILLRLAEVYPRWLVHVGYGEYADLDPHLAALNMNKLPADELCPPPQKPNRQLHTRFWSAGRARGVGMEGTFVRQVVEAYDLIRSAQEGSSPLMTDAQQRKIEKDLLLEGTVLLVADKAVNNKSVGNATAAALVGIALGHPGMVRFGLDVFQKTVDGWFLSEGGTSESWGYASMTLHGIEALPMAVQGYSDPPGYRDAEGKRIDRLDLFQTPAYNKVWQAMFNGLQGDLHYPPLADDSGHNGLGARYAELLSIYYPKQPQYLALLRALASKDQPLSLQKSLAGGDLAAGDPQLALYHRPAGLEERSPVPLAFSDHLFPDLQIGYVRSGETGRDSLLVLSASDWGNHHHYDSLGIYYWHKGQEVLTDLGYLWDHPQKHMAGRTFAHHTVMIDGAEQRSKGRGGRFTLFASEGPVKVMEAESQAYAQASVYRRTVAQVEYAPGRQYVVDLFRVSGGKEHRYVFHGPNRELAVAGPTLTAQPAWKDHLENAQGTTAAEPWRLTWKMPDGSRFSALWRGVEGETTLLGDGWGQRDYRNSDLGATVPYLVRVRTGGTATNCYVTVFEAHPEAGPWVKAVEILPAPQAAKDVVVIALTTQSGTDYLVSRLQPGPLSIETPSGILSSTGRFSAGSVQNGKWSWKADLPKQETRE